MEQIGVGVLVSLAAVVAMTSVLEAIRLSGIVPVHMVRTVGRVLTRNHADALGVGWMVHIIAGVLFGLFYIAVWSGFQFESTAVLTVVGALVGLGHGLVASFLLVAVLLDSRQAPAPEGSAFGTVVSHLLAHVVFGAVMGVLVGSLELSFSFIKPVV